MAQNRSASSRVPPSASTCRTQTCGTCRSAGTARIACFVSSHIRTVSFMPVINGGGSAEGGSTGVAAGSAPLAARSAIRPLTWSGDIDAGNCNTTVAPAGSAAHPTGVTQSRSSSPKARDRAAITEYLSGFASITRLPGRTGGRSGIGASRPLRRIPAIVTFLNPQPALSLVGGNRSSFPTPAVRDTRRDRASLKATTDTQFLIGSVTKSFTSTGLALLMDERRIDWTKPVRDYIPEFRLHDAVATDRITTVLRRLSGERCEVGAQVAFDQPGLLPSEGAALAFGNVVSSCRYSASQGAVSAGARRQSLSPRAALPADPSAMTRRTRPHNFWT